jgi:metal-responsive CopG/Arc/MetJ family transcriptional regulator
MRSVVSLSLPKRLARDLTRLARQLGVPRSLVVRQALQRYVLDVELTELRRRLRPRALRRGMISDDDIFARVS